MLPLLVCRISQNGTGVSKHILVSSVNTTGTDRCGGNLLHKSPRRNQRSPRSIPYSSMGQWKHRQASTCCCSISAKFQTSYQKYVTSKATFPLLSSQQIDEDYSPDMSAAFNNFSAHDGSSCKGAATDRNISLPEDNIVNRRRDSCGKKGKAVHVKIDCRCLRCDSNQEK